MSLSFSADHADLSLPENKRSFPSVAPSMPNPNSGIFDRSLTRVIQSQAKKPNREFFESVHDGLLRAWRAQVEVRRYWEVVEDIKREQAVEVGANMRRSDVGDQQLGSWPQDEKFQWRTNCEWLMNVSRRGSSRSNGPRVLLTCTGLTTVYKLPVPALSIFPDATSRYCIVK